MQAPTNGSLGMRNGHASGELTPATASLFDQGTTIRQTIFSFLYTCALAHDGPKKTGICAAGCTAQATGSKNKTGSAKKTTQTTHLQHHAGHVIVKKRSSEANEPTAVGHAGGAHVLVDGFELGRLGFVLGKASSRPCSQRP